ncbi:hypothetical protein PIB30_060947 [Stylosanthes scabra]|uniref:Uncharacterized protein n=1 Tax=Stylosanthes scabra TaxID=79078 RepID=A0ABU6XJN0_9FABA|nr:hypothetical protein [Stylosanthes scabra]
MKGVDLERDECGVEVESNSKQCSGENTDCDWTEYEDAAEMYVDGIMKKFKAKMVLLKSQIRLDIGFRLNRFDRRV